MKFIEIDAPAKINWRLAVTGRRPEGYHELMGLMQTISLYDRVVLLPGEKDSCRTYPPLPGGEEDNLALRAWLLLKEELGLHKYLTIDVTKRIPVGGGLGGGSADAAAVLKGANSLFSLGLSLSELAVLGLKLGADVPFCLYGGLARAEGVGEILTPLPEFAPLTLLLVNPGFAVPTAQVFAHYKASGRPFSLEAAEQQACEGLTKALAKGDIAAINSFLANDLAPSARELYPQIGLVESCMEYLGLVPLLSGSGGTVFALLRDTANIRHIQGALNDFPWIYVAQTLRS